MEIRTPSFFAPKSSHRLLAEPTRDSDAWVVALAQHVEPRRVSAGQNFALALIGLLVAFALGLALSSCKPASLDSAQAALESDTRLERSRGYNWPVFKQANSLAKLKCRDVADRSLRLCTISMPSVDPATGAATGVDIIDDFACSTTTCEWFVK